MKRVTCVVAGLMAFAVSSAAQAPTAGQKVPAPDSELRTYGQRIGHQADNQFTNCATLEGATSPSPAQSNEKKATRAELVKALADAFAFCDGALSALTDQNALQMITQGDGETARGAVVSALLSHGLESYGRPICVHQERRRRAYALECS